MQTIDIHIPKAQVFDEVAKTKPTPLRDKLWVGLLGLIAGATIASFIRWK